MVLSELGKYTEIFTGWTSKEINIAWQMLIFLRKTNVSLEEFELFAEHRQNEWHNDIAYTQRMLFLRSKFFRSHALKCALCGKTMDIGSVNEDKATKVPNKKIKSVWTCPHAKCSFQVWNKKPVSFYVVRTQKKFEAEYGQSTVEDIVSMDMPNEYANFIKSKAPVKRSKCGGK